MSEFFITLIPPLGRIESIRCQSRELALEELQRLVGGYIETVPATMLRDISPDLLMLVDEDGKFKDVNVMNPVASLVFASPHDYIVGRAVIVTRYNPDPEAEPDLYAMEDDTERQVFFRLLELERALNN